jgi:hypothetical protein
MLWLAIGPPTSLESPDEFLALCEEFAKTRNYFDDDPKTALRNLGLEQDDFTVHEPWDQFPVVRRFLEVWDATERYVDAMVDVMYANDGDVIRDAALMSWIAAARSPLDGNVRGLPLVRSRQTLKDVLTSLLFRIASHGLSNFTITVHPALSFASNFPPCLHTRTIPRPNTVLSTQDLLNMLPSTDTLGRFVDFLYIFIYSTPHERFIPESGVGTELFFPGGPADPRNAALIRLRSEILNFAAGVDPSVGGSLWPLSIEL